MEEWGDVIGTFIVLVLMLVGIPWIYEKTYLLRPGKRYNNTIYIISNSEVKRKIGS